MPQKTKKPLLKVRAAAPIPFRVTEEEKEEILAAAERVGLTVSAYIRNCILEDKPKMRATRRPTIEAETLAKLLGQMGKAVYGIQELSKKTNKNNKVDKEITKTLKDVQKTVAAIMTSLNRKPHDH